MSVLRKVPKGERNLVRAAGILSSPADQRAKVNADCHLQSISRWCSSLLLSQPSVPVRTDAGIGSG